LKGIHAWLYVKASSMHMCTWPSSSAAKHISAHQV